jgi:hypothetical protein
MRVGETGEAYFVFETDEAVPEDLIASPMSEAVPEAEMDEPVRCMPWPGPGPSDVRLQLNAIESLDLGPPVVSAPSASDTGAHWSIARLSDAWSQHTEKALKTSHVGASRRILDVR